MNPAMIAATDGLVIGLLVAILAMTSIAAVAALRVARAEFYREVRSG